MEINKMQTRCNKTGNWMAKKTQPTTVHNITKQIQI